jgi:hypothetical protein
MNFITQQAVSEQSLTVETVSLDDFCALKGIQHIDLLKIDIQGNEPEALRGAARLLAERRIRCIFMELNWSEDFSLPCPASEAVEILTNCGFQFALPKAGALPQAAGPWLRDLSDVVAILP